MKTIAIKTKTVFMHLERKSYSFRIFKHIFSLFRQISKVYDPPINSRKENSFIRIVSKTITIKKNALIIAHFFIKNAMISYF